jgi:hypothetical protein
MMGARASLDVRSKAIGGDLARLGAGGVPASGGEAVAMIARGVGWSE